MALIATTILHDAPSQNWTSQKPFYEGIIIEAMFQFCHAHKSCILVSRDQLSLNDQTMYR